MTKKENPAQTQGPAAPLNIYQRLHAVMKDISYVQKEDKLVNKQYKFVSHDAVTAKVRGALVEHGIMAIPTVKEFHQDGNRTTATINVDFVNIDKPDDKVSIECFGYGIDSQDKGPGKAYSYAYKYALLKMFALETGDDPERDNVDHESDRDKQAKEFKRIQGLLKAANDGSEAYATWTANEDDILKLPEAGQTSLMTIRDRFMEPDLGIDDNANM